LAGLLI